MNKIESIKEITDDELTYLGCSPEEYEDAIIGIAHRFGSDMIVAYDYDKVLESLAEIKLNKKEAMTHTSMLSGIF